jgi:hypothetical protein
MLLLLPLTLLIVRNTSAEVCDSCSHGVMNRIGSAHLIGAQVQTLAFEKVISPCMVAAWESAEGSVKDTIKNAPHLAGRIWNSLSEWACLLGPTDGGQAAQCVSKKLQTLQELAHGLYMAIRNSISYFSELDASVQAEIACGLIGQIGLAGAISYVTMGLAKSQYAAIITKYFAKLKTITPLLTKPSGLKSVEDQVLLVRGLGKMPQESLQLMRFMQSTGQGHLIKGVVKCAF